MIPLLSLKLYLISVLYHNIFLLKNHFYFSIWFGNAKFIKKIYYKNEKTYKLMLQWMWLVIRVAKLDTTREPDTTWHEINMLWVEA